MTRPAGGSPSEPPAGSNSGAPDAVALRRAVLAVSVLDDIDAEPGPEGVVLPGEPRVEVPWHECRRVLAAHDPEGEPARARLCSWLRARRWAADVGPSRLRELLRPVGLPVDHLLHPGLDWVRSRILGDALDLGLGAVGLDPADPDRVVLLPQPALDAAALDPDLCWPYAHAYLEDMGALAAELLARDARGQLRPVGDCDAVTLLGARRLRRALASAAGGMCPVVVPMRRRGWTRLALVDPAFGPAAAAATAEAERGFARPLLITVDEVTLVAAGGRPEQIVLTSSPTREQPWDRAVLYR